MPVTFSVIIPTVGRPSLVYALKSIAPQLEPGDELLVARNNDGDFGNAARNDFIARARGSHLVFLDDDDEWVPTALDKMRRFANAYPDKVGIFRLRHEFHRDVWQRRELGEFGTPMAVVPNVPSKIGKFARADVADPLLRAPRTGETMSDVALRWSDYEFLRSTLELRGDEPVWVPEVTTIIRP